MTPSIKGKKGVLSKIFSGRKSKSDKGKSDGEKVVGSPSFESGEGQPPPSPEAPKSGPVNEPQAKDVGLSAIQPQSLATDVEDSHPLSAPNPANDGNVQGNEHAVIDGHATKYGGGDKESKELLSNASSNDVPTSTPNDAKPSSPEMDDGSTAKTATESYTSADDVPESVHLGVLSGSVENGLKIEPNTNSIADDPKAGIDQPDVVGIESNEFKVEQKSETNDKEKESQKEENKPVVKGKKKEWIEQRLAAMSASSPTKNVEKPTTPIGHEQNLERRKWIEQTLLTQSKEHTAPNVPDDVKQLREKSGSIAARKTWVEGLSKRSSDPSGESSVVQTPTRGKAVEQGKFMTELMAKKNDPKAFLDAKEKISTPPSKEWTEIKKQWVVETLEKQLDPKLFLDQKEKSSPSPTRDQTLARKKWLEETMAGQKKTDPVVEKGSPSPSHEMTAARKKWIEETLVKSPDKKSDAATPSVTPSPSREQTAAKKKWIEETLLASSDRRLSNEVSPTK